MKMITLYCTVLRHEWYSSTILRPWWRYLWKLEFPTALSYYTTIPHSSTKKERQENCGTKQTPSNRSGKLETNWTFSTKPYVLDMVFGVFATIENPFDFWEWSVMWRWHPWKCILSQSEKPTATGIKSFFEKTTTHSTWTLNETKGRMGGITRRFFWWCMQTMDNRSCQPANP